jgi:hypothetical protein
MTGFIFALASATAFSADSKPVLRFSIAPDGTAQITPLFAGVEPGKTPYQWVWPTKSGENTWVGLVWTQPNGRPGSASYVLPLAFEGAPGPTPGPTPVPPTPIPPTPIPPPTPPADLWGVVVEESSARTPAQGIVLLSPKVRALFRPQEFRLLDKDPPATPDMQPWINLAKAKGLTLPVLFLFDSKGVVYYQGDLPATVAAMETLVGKIKTGGQR